MDLEQFRNYCLSKKGVAEGFPFDRETAVYKVMGKMFALTNVHLFDGINLKCDPEKAADLRERYEAVRPGYHMNKKHWNTIAMDGSIPDKLVYQWIDHSYDLVTGSLSKAHRKKLGLG